MHHMKIKHQQRLVDGFNKNFPIGTFARYWRGARQGEPSGEGRTTTTAQLLGGHTAVVWIEGCSGAMALSHVEILT